jgi:hypothetical protein
MVGEVHADKGGSMTSTTTATTFEPHLTATEARAARRAGWLLIAAFLAFVAAVAVMIGLLQEFNEALEESAATAGVDLNDLTAEAIAPMLARLALWNRSSSTRSDNVMVTQRDNAERFDAWVRTQAAKA